MGDHLIIRKQPLNDTISPSLAVHRLYPGVVRWSNREHISSSTELFNQKMLQSYAKLPQTTSQNLLTSIKDEQRGKLRSHFTDPSVGKFTC